MEVNPVMYIDRPKYPLKTELKEEELKKRIPKRWMQCPAAKIALGTLAAVALAGCAPEIMPGDVQAITPPTEASVSATPAAYTFTRPITSLENSYLEDYVEDGAPMGKYAICTLNIAPIFLHGEGLGAFSGDAASMPAFLSEDEALEIINETAKGYGLEFSGNDGIEFLNVRQPSIDINPPYIYCESPAPSETFITLKPDFVDNEHGIVIEFVSKDDVKQWSREAALSSTEVYKTKDAAAQLSEALEEAFGGSYAVGVFYDPCENPDNSKPGSEEQLAAQAKDFFEWLKTQEIL